MSSTIGLMTLTCPFDARASLPTLGKHVLAQLPWQDGSIEVGEGVQAKSSGICG